MFKLLIQYEGKNEGDETEHQTLKDCQKDVDQTVSWAPVYGLKVLSATATDEDGSVHSLYVRSAKIITAVD